MDNNINSEIARLSPATEAEICVNLCAHLPHSIHELVPIFAVHGRIDQDYEGQPQLYHMKEIYRLLSQSYLQFSREIPETI